MVASTTRKTFNSAGSPEGHFKLIDHVDVALECGYVSDNEGESLINQIKTAIRMLNGYIKYLRNRKEAE